MREFQKLSIKDFKLKTNKWLIQYTEYMNELTKINKAENAEIKSITLEKYIDQYDEYVNRFPEKVEMYKNQRKELKEKYREYSSYFNCPYYCVIHNKKELDELIPEEKRGEKSNYKQNIEGLKKFTGKKLQDECHKDVHGDFIGIVFYIDEEYWLIKDDKTGKERCLLCAELFNGERIELPYHIVENGKDYL